VKQIPAGLATHNPR